MKYNKLRYKLRWKARLYNLVLLLVSKTKPYQILQRKLNAANAESKCWERRCKASEEYVEEISQRIADVRMHKDDRTGSIEFHVHIAPDAFYAAFEQGNDGLMLDVLAGHITRESMEKLRTANSWRP